MNAEKTADLNATPDVSELLGRAKEVHARFYPPGAPALTAKMQAACREPWLFLQSRRFVNWLVRPGMLLLLAVGTWFAGFSGPTVGFFASMFVACAVYCVLGQFCGDVVMRFLMLVQLAPHAGGVALMDRQQRQRWYGRVRRWFEVNRLAGPNANRWLWDRMSREKFEWAYDTACRCAAAEGHVPIEAEGMTDEERRVCEATRGLLEELPLCGEMLFHEKFWPVTVFLLIMECYLTMWGALYLSLVL